MHSFHRQSDGLHSFFACDLTRPAGGDGGGPAGGSKVRRSDGRGRAGGLRGPSVGREDDGCVRGPQRPRCRPEQRRAQEGRLDEGGGGCSGGGAHWVAQCQGVGGHRAQGGRGQLAGQEAGRQALRQLLLQGQFGLEEEPEGEGEEQEGERVEPEGRGLCECVCFSPHVFFYTTTTIVASKTSTQDCGRMRHQLLPA